VLVLCVIPARLGSSRLPRKPLLLLAGEPLILHVVRRVADLHLCDRLIVATDATEIAAAVEQSGFEAVLTSAHHQSGTERIAEVTGRKEFARYSRILNVQGDEPFVPAEAITGALACLERGDPLGTAAAPLDAEQADDPSRVKVVVDVNGRALYFSRARIPFDRDGRGGVSYRQHIGVYAYTRDALERWVRLPPVAEERSEGLEQLRPLLHGMPMGVALIDRPAAPGIDTPADLRWAQAEVSR
jgi:3-deoxy-manno-octulosonate cytidylyltransferase (CMP-KDO synthetase)